MKPKIRVLHVLGGMNRGGVETWLMHVLRHVDRTQYRMDFLVHSNKRCVFDDEIESLGSRVIHCGGLPNPVRYASQFTTILRNYGPYDVVHSHPHSFSGLVVRLSAALGVPVRIAHSHSDRSMIACLSPARRVYLALMRRWIKQYATVRLGASGQAAADLFGDGWQARSKLLYYGIDLKPFRQAVDSAQVRHELGITPGEVVFGHVGRFDPPKNHMFLLDVAAEVLRRMPRARFLLVGDGALRRQIEQKAIDLQISDKLILTGIRPDAPRLMKGAMDVFLFPSIYEGLPLALLEAQAAGLPCVISTTIDRDIDVIPALVKRMPLSESVHCWASELLASAANTGTYSAEDCCAALDTTPYSATATATELTRLYRSEHAHTV